MRLSCLVVIVFLLAAVSLRAEHSAGGGSSSSSGSSSHSSSSSGSSGHSSSSSSSHVGSTGGSGSSRGTFGSSSQPGTPRTPAPKSNSSAKTERKSFFSFLRHHKTVPASAFLANARWPICRNGMHCGCLAGSRNRQCIYPTQFAPCSAGALWNNYGCGSQYWFSGCRLLADQLSALQSEMSMQNDPGLSLRYRLLRDEYERCLQRSRFFAFDATPLPLLFATP